MKKLFVISLLALALLSAQLPALTPAYYAQNSISGPVLAYGVQTPLNETFFATKQNGVVTLAGDTWTPNGYTGLINISGNCRFKRNPVYFSLVIEIYGGSGYYVLVASDDLVTSFSMAVPAAPMRLLAYQLDPNGANGIACTILFQAVQ